MSDDLRNASPAARTGLRKLDPSADNAFSKPSKRINDGEDLAAFLVSQAYVDIMTFLLQLNKSMFPTITIESKTQDVHVWPTDALEVSLSPQAMRVSVIIQTLENMILDAPAEVGPRRFGNAAFRTWYKAVEARTPELIAQALQLDVWDYTRNDAERQSLKEELGAYFLGSFGDSQRLDYGTGHELSFLAFLGCIWKLNGFASAAEGEEERGIVFGIIEPYLKLVRKLIMCYSLEPAGSHGVWGLDDHCFLSYIFGSAQYATPMRSDSIIPTEGSLPGAPPLGIVTDKAATRAGASSNMYLGAVDFIYSVKSGPFWEHSPILYNVSGVPGGWAKVNKGMIKMYNAEVLSKFPVVQHFPFGSLFRFERDPQARAPPVSTHASNQPSSDTAQSSMASNPASQSMRAPWAGTNAMLPPPGRFPATTTPALSEAQRTARPTGRELPARFRGDR